jgi:hypothetical protein
MVVTAESLNRKTNPVNNIFSILFKLTNIHEQGKEYDKELLKIMKIISDTTYEFVTRYKPLVKKSDPTRLKYEISNLWNQPHIASYEKTNEKSANHEEYRLVEYGSLYYPTTIQSKIITDLLTTLGIFKRGLTMTEMIELVKSKSPKIFVGAGYNYNGAYNLSTAVKGLLTLNNLPSSLIPGLEAEVVFNHENKPILMNLYANPNLFVTIISNKFTPLVIQPPQKIVK